MNLNLTDQVPLLQNAGINGKSVPKKKKEEVFYFAPNTPSQRSLMDVELPDTPSFFRILVMACCPCLALPLCSPEKKQEFKRAPRTVTVFICFVQIVMFAAALGLDGFEDPASNWLLGPTEEALVELGAKQGSLMRYKYEMWRYFTPIFLHAGIIQLIVNIFGQLRMGLYLEKKWKWYVFTAVYFISGIAGIALSCDIQPNSISVGASAAFMGVMGGYFAQLHLTWFKMEGWQKRMNMFVCLSFIVVTFLEGIGRNNVDTTAHAGGLAMGLIQGYSLFGLQYARRWNPRRARAVPVLGIVCMLIYLAVTITVFYTVVPVKKQEQYW